MVEEGANQGARVSAVRSPWRDINTSDHYVQFYETDAFLLDALGEFVSAGLEAGDSCIVIATEAHRQGLNTWLKAKRPKLPDAQTRGAYLWMDADETLAKMMVAGSPDPERFAAVVGSVIARAAEGHRHVRAFGEMVALLWAEGNPAAAVRLEELWNELRDRTQSFSLLCAYPMHGFAREVYGTSFAEICERHSRVLPDESYAALTNEDARLRAITLLQQKAASLEAEIAERRAAEERLRISENRYRRLFEASRDGILIVDPASQTIDDANPIMAQLLGYSHEELLGRELWQIGLFPDRAAALALLRELRQQRFARYEMLPLQTRDGQRRYVEFVSTRFRANGHDIIQCNLRDITGRKHAEALLRQEQERLRFMAESMPQKIFTAKPNGAVDYFNPQWMEFTGLSFEEIRDWGWTQFIHPDDIEENLSRWRHALETGEPFYCEHRFRRADGAYCWHVSRAIPIRDTDGAITMWIGSDTDIDEQKQLEERKNAFISMASHELKTPVTSIKGFTQILQRRLQRQQADPQTLLFLDRMDAQLKKLTDLIGDLLDVSKMQSGTLAFREADVDLDDLVYETVENVQAAVTTHKLYVRGATHALVHGDQDRLGQVLINLLTNAIKYSPEADTVLVHLHADHERVEVAVQDFGIGIIEEHHEHIFERFYQVNDQRENTYPGLGIGLYIAHTLVEQHGGRLWLESHQGTGSTFHFTLPRLSGEQDARDPDVSPAHHEAQ